MILSIKVGNVGSNEDVIAEAEAQFEIKMEIMLLSKVGTLNVMR